MSYVGQQEKKRSRSSSGTAPLNMINKTGKAGLARIKKSGGHVLLRNTFLGRPPNILGEKDKLISYARNMPKARQAAFPSLDMLRKHLQPRWLRTFAAVAPAVKR